MFWINGLEMELSGHSLWLGHLLKKKGRTLCFAGFMTMSSTLLMTAGAFIGFFTRSLGREPWSSLRRNPKCKETLYPTTRENEWWL